MIRTIAKLTILTAAALTLCQCDRIRAILHIKPPPTPYAYNINVILTPQAAADLKSQDDVIAVEGYYYGEANAANMSKGDDLNRIELGDEQNVYGNTGGNLHMLGKSINEKLFPEIKDAQPFVLVTVSAATKDGSRMPRLECENFVGPIRQAQRLTPNVHCDLNPDRDVPP